MSLPPAVVELTPFAEVLRAAAAQDLAGDTWRWLSEQGEQLMSAERRLPALTVVASVYAKYCAPNDATDLESAQVARFTLLFFLVDDAAEGDVPDLLSSTSAWSIGRYTPALRRWLTEFAPEQAHAPARLREHFASAYHDYLQARRREHENKARPLDVEGHWAFRRRSIFMEPYLDLWLLLKGVDPDAVAEQEFATARALAVDLVLLANDLASAERDSAQGASPDDLNLIHSYARHYREDELAALERLVTIHDELVEQYSAALASARAARPGSHAERYADVLSGVVKGNVASVLALAFRYPGAAQVMRRLRAVR